MTNTDAQYSNFGEGKEGPPEEVTFTAGMSHAGVGERMFPAEQVVPRLLEALCGWRGESEVRKVRALPPQGRSF